MESVNEKISFVEMMMQTFTQIEETMIQQRFAFMFFHQIAFYTRFAKENVENAKLCQFAEQLLKLKLENEITPLKKIISVFNGGKEC